MRECVTGQQTISTVLVQVHVTKDSALDVA